MLIKIVFSVILLGFLPHSHCNDHTYGIFQLGDKKLIEKELFAKTSTIPKNYTVIFKYIAPDFSPTITFAEFKITNNNSSGIIDVKSEPGKDKTLQATLNIVNGTDVRVTATIYGSSISLSSNMGKMNANKLIKPKTFTIVYGHNATQTRNRKINLGQRQHGDKLIEFVTKNVTLSILKRFPEEEFAFYNKQKYITSVGFSFDSPTAIAFVNSTYVKQNGLNVIVYDLNSPQFVANMSIYGYDEIEKPIDYQQIVSSKRTSTI